MYGGKSTWTSHGNEQGHDHAYPPVDANSENQWAARHQGKCWCPRDRHLNRRPSRRMRYPGLESRTRWLPAGVLALLVAEAETGTSNAVVVDARRSSSEQQVPFLDGHQEGPEGCSLRAWTGRISG